jgi:hypothetical protein
MVVSMAELKALSMADSTVVKMVGLMVASKVELTVESTVVKMVELMVD